MVKGRNRDTMIFSLLDGEWPAIRSALAAWLSPENLDECAKGKGRLEAMRTSAAGQSCLIPPGTNNDDPRIR
ncbi:hypothetical protein CN880_12135 [Ochrobactrum sp. 720/2009]|nr:hypothetical protein CN880_12135 [Ochrobactrum sp. 720/2009]